MKVYVDDRQFDVQAEGTEEAARKVYGELKKQMDVRSWKLSLEEEGKTGKSKVSCTSR